VVCVVTSSCAGTPRNRGPFPGRSERFFYFPKIYRPALGPIQPPIQWVPGDVKIKPPGREAEHSPSSAEVNNYYS
jgi:hypothetical protein